MNPATADELLFSDHARRRSQQRSIPPAVVEYLLRFGTSRYCGDGAERIFFTRKGREALAASLQAEGDGKRLDHFSNAYLVVGGNGRIVTVGHGYRRFRNH
jgi:hypothetical protein